MLDGGAGNDTILSRGDGDLTQNLGDSIYGGDGNDDITVLGNVTAIDGGAGIDTVHFNNAHVHDIDLAASHVENFSVYLPINGTSVADHIDLSGATLVDYNGMVSVIDLRGGDGADTLITGAGNDYLYGEDGNDVLEGGAGNDTIDGGGAWNAPGVDVASYEHATAAVTVDLRLQDQQQDTKGAGRDYLTHIEGVRGSVFADSLTGGNGNDLLQGGAGNDTLRGCLGGDTIEGGDGNDWIYGGGRYTDVIGTPPYTDKPLYPDNLTTETLKGGAGADTYVFNGFDDWGSWINFQSGTVTGGPGQVGNVVHNYSEFAYGGDSPTQVEFNAAEGDRLALGNAVFNGHDESVTGNLGIGISYRFVGDHTEVYYVESYLSSTGTGVTTFGTVGAHIVLSSKVELRQVTDNGVTYYVGMAATEGTAGNDQLTNTAAGGSLYGYAGDDTLDSGTGNDWLNGGEGADTADYSASNGAVRVDLNITGDQNTGGGGTDKLVSIENVTGSGYNDILIGNAGSNTLWGGAGHDSLFGGAGNDVLDGGAGNDSLNGAAGADIMSGGSGDDIYFVDSALDQAIEIALGGIDSVRASVDYHLSDNIEYLYLTGGTNLSGFGNTQDNDIFGNSGNNFLDGGAGNDTLQGGDGNDSVLGAVGSDSLSGGTGNDSLDGGAQNDILNGGGRLGHPNRRKRQRYSRRRLG